MTNLLKLRHFIKELGGIQTEDKADMGDYISEEWQIDGVTIYLTSEPSQDKESHQITSQKKIIR